jgi:hypothetical protein
MVEVSRYLRNLVIVERSAGVAFHPGDEAIRGAEGPVPEPRNRERNRQPNSERDVAL